MAILVEANIAPLKVNHGKLLSGIFAEIGVFNQNERRYPSDVYMPAYEELIPKIQSRRLLGELDHPLDYDEVRLANVSHVITECHVDESGGIKRIYGTVELLDTPAGRIAQALVRAGVQLGISSRGVGNTKKVAKGVDVTQLKLITYDLVADPSFKNAVLSEDKKLELEESLSSIESRLPLNESKEHSNIRETILRIRESLCTDTSSAESQITREDIQNLEISSLRKLLDSKVATINEDTSLLKRQRQKITEQEATISKLTKAIHSSDSRYKAMQRNHDTLQESYNALQEKHDLRESAELSKKDAEILELRKRLAVEQRGMSYPRVKKLLEGVTSADMIDEVLNNISSMNTRSVNVIPSMSESIKESIKPKPSGSKLSKMISRV